MPVKNDSINPVQLKLYRRFTPHLRLERSGHLIAIQVGKLCRGDRYS